MDDLADRLSRIVVNATSPDRNITAQAGHGDQVDVRFRPGAFRAYNARQLEHQLRQLAARYSIQLSAPLGPNSTDLNRMSAADLDITGNNQFYDR